VTHALTRHDQGKSGHQNTVQSGDFGARRTRPIPRGERAVRQDTQGRVVCSRGIARPSSQPDLPDTCWKATSPCVSCPLRWHYHRRESAFRPSAHGRTLRERTRGALASWWQQRRRSRRGNTITILFPGYQSILPFEFVVEQDVCDKPKPVQHQYQCAHGDRRRVPRSTGVSTSLAERSVRRSWPAAKDTPQTDDVPCPKAPSASHRMPRITCRRYRCPLPYLTLLCTSRHLP